MKELAAKVVGELRRSEFHPDVMQQVKSDQSRNTMEYLFS